VIEDIESEDGGSRQITVRLNPKELGQYEALA
jgi:GTP-binding protein HflX